jgi:hypothetical protein
MLTNPIVTENLSHLLKELEWLGKIVQCQVSIYKKHQPKPKAKMADESDSIIRRSSLYDLETIKRVIAEGIECISPPLIKPDGTSLAGIICENELGFYDRLLLILALAPHIDPILLQDELMEKEERVGSLVGGVRGTNSGIFLPTGQTFIFLVAGKDIEKRLQIIDWLSHECILIAGNVIKIQPVLAGEIYLSGGLEMDEYYLELLLTNRSNKTLSTQQQDVRRETTGEQA